MGLNLLGRHNGLQLPSQSVLLHSFNQQSLLIRPDDPAPSFAALPFPCALSIQWCPLASA